MIIQALTMLAWGIIALLGIAFLMAQFRVRGNPQQSALDRWAGLVAAFTVHSAAALAAFILAAAQMISEAAFHFPRAWGWHYRALLRAKDQGD